MNIRVLTLVCLLKLLESSVIIIYLYCEEDGEDLKISWKRVWKILFRTDIRYSSYTARLYKVGLGVKRPPSDVNPKMKTDSNEGLRRVDQAHQPSDALEVDSRDDAQQDLDGERTS